MLSTKLGKFATYVSKSLKRANDWLIYARISLKTQSRMKKKKLIRFQKRVIKKESRMYPVCNRAKGVQWFIFSFPFRMYPRHSIGPSLDWATTSVLSPGWDTPRIPGAPADSDTTTPVGVTWIKVTRGCIAPVAIAWGIRWWRRAEVCAARRSSSTCGGTFRPAPAHATTWAMGITWTIRWVKNIFTANKYIYVSLNEGFSEKVRCVLIKDRFSAREVNICVIVHNACCYLYLL